MIILSPSPNMSVKAKYSMSDSPHKPAITVQEFSGDGALQIVHSYGGGGFRITKESYVGSQFIMPRLRLDWSITTADDVTFDGIMAMLGDERPALLLLGLGEAPMTNLPVLGKALSQEGVRLEVMSTPAACRTWNVMVSEGRSAAAGLLAID